MRRQGLAAALVVRGQPQVAESAEGARAVGTTQVRRYCHSSSRLLAGRIWLAKFDSTTVSKCVSSTFSGLLLLHQGVLWPLTLALRAFPRCDNGVIHGINEVIYPGWSETDASTQDGTGQTMNV